MSILLEGISKRYAQQTVVNNVSLEVKNGEFFVLLGSSGSGKTTVLNIIAGLVNADDIKQTSIPSCVVEDKCELKTPSINTTL